MIKLSKITETYWSNMNKRAQGTRKRKEDNIELLNMTGLYEYILANYELTDKRHEITYGTENMSITISKNGREEILLTYGFDEIHLYFNLEKDTKLFYVLTENYNVEKWDSSQFTKYHYVVTPKNGHSNKFFIDVLNDIIENKNTILRKKTYINETYWSGMNKRSQGVKVRKEDDIDMMNIETFCEYLKSIYKSDDKNSIQLVFINFGFGKEDETMLSVRIYEDESGIPRYLFYDSNERINIQYMVFKELGCVEEVKNKYSLKINKNSFDVDIADIYPQNNSASISNKFFIEVLDFILDKIDVPFEAKIEKI